MHENLEHGRFNLTPEEIEKAKKEGKLEELKEKAEQATARIHGKEGEGARESLEKELEK
ncbi:MAG: hypothetical protein HY764_02135 [Candidatus Portnoybacteria bacterium]|nr:hypothetical protein [Candidatus Portnoybacteria bacterium]